MYGLSRDRRLSVQFYQIAVFHCFMGRDCTAGNVGGCLSEATDCFFSYRSVNRKLYDVEPPCPLSGP